MEDGVILEHGRSARLNVEEEVKQGVGSATTLIQRLVELTVLAAIRNLRNVIFSTVQVRLKFAYERVYCSTKSVSTKTIFPPYTISDVHNCIDSEIATLVSCST